MTIRKLVGFFIRVFIIAFVFIMDVRVKADDDVLGKSSKFTADTLTEMRSDGSLDFFKGKGYFVLPRTNNSTIIHTPQGVLESNGGVFLIEVSEGKSTVSVISGKVTLNDRASKKKFTIDGGYSYWLGGLTAMGVHEAPLAIDAYDFDRVMIVIKTLSGWSEKEFDSRMTDFKPLWRQAVVDVAERNQNNINRDIKKINEMIAAQEKKDVERMRARARVHELFRRRALPESVEKNEPSREPAATEEEL